MYADITLYTCIKKLTINYSITQEGRFVENTISDQIIKVPMTFDFGAHFKLE